MAFTSTSFGALYYAACISKGGEGSRGGHIVAHTKSGLAVYASHHPRNLPIKQSMDQDHHDGAVAALTAHPAYSKQDHLDAAEAHANHAGQTQDKADRHASHQLSQAHAEASMMQRRHDRMSPRD